MVSLGLGSLGQPVWAASPTGLTERDRGVIAWVAEAERMVEAAGIPAPLAFDFVRTPLLLVDPSRMAMVFHVRSLLPGFRRAQASRPGGVAVQWRAGQTSDLETSALETRYGGVRLATAPYDLLPTLFPTGPSPASLLVLGLTARVREVAPWTRALGGPAGRESVSDSELVSREMDALGTALAAPDEAGARLALGAFVAARRARQARMSDELRQAEGRREVLRALIRHWPARIQAAEAGRSSKGMGGWPAWRHASQLEHEGWLRSRCAAPLPGRAGESERLLVTALAQARLLERLKVADWPAVALRDQSLVPALAAVLELPDGPLPKLLSRWRDLPPSPVGWGRGAMDRAERLSAFEMQPGVTIAIQLPAPSGVRSRGPRKGLTWTPAARLPLPIDARTVLLEGLMSLRYEHGDRSLDVLRLPVLGIGGERGWTFGRVVLRADPTSLRILLDGRPWARVPGMWPVRRRLELLHPKFRFVTSRGRLRIDEDRIEVEAKP